MDTTIKIISIVLLAIIAYQDFKDRMISWIPLVMLCLLFYILSTISNSNANALLYTGINLLILCCQLITLTIYISIKNKKLINIIDSHIGLGDVLFFILLCPLFSPLNFILFYISCLSISVFLFLTISKLAAIPSKEVPLAGLMSVLLIITFIINWENQYVNFYDDYLILKKLNWI